MSFNSSQSEQKPLFKSTGFSSADQGGRISLDPTIRGFEDTALQGISKASGAFGGQISQLRQSALGNLPDFVNAQVNPMRQQFAQDRGALTRGLTNRGLGGSSFLGGAQTAQGIDQQRALQDAGASALGAGVSQIANLSQQELAAAGLTPQLQMKISQARTERELKQLLAQGQKSSSFGVNLLGGAEELGAIALLSDPRAKKNIKKVGDLFNGLAVYLFNYKSGGPTMMGVMADEVEKIIPEAVSSRQDGYKQVRYDLLGDS